MTSIFVFLVLIGAIVCMFTYYVGRLVGYCLYKFWQWANNAYAEYVKED